MIGNGGEWVGMGQNGKETFERVELVGNGGE